MPRLENLPRNQLSFRRSANNLHIATGEDLDLEQARAILNLMRCHSSDCNKFFIDVRHVTRIQPAAAAALRGAPQPCIAPQRIHYKGSRGFELAASGNKVLIVPAPTAAARTKRPAPGRGIRPGRRPRRRGAPLSPDGCEPQTVRKKVMKKIFTLMLAAGMLLGAASGARAIDFKASGEWLVGFGLGDGSLIKDVNDQKRHQDDTFNAGQRIRLQLDAVASETLSGTVFFEIGDQMWGQSESGGALGADSTSVVKLKNAYIDWMVPNTDLKLRMGLQAVALPNVAGGSAIMDGDAAAVVASYQFNENVGLTALWMRPLNDNYTGTNADGEAYGNGYKNYLDNMDLFALMLPLKFDGVELTPWAMYGLQGKNTRFNEGGVETADGALNVTLPGYYPGMNFGPGGLGHTGKSYGSMFWAGLPVAITAFDPLNIEFDINYGYVEAMGRYDVLKRGVESVLGNSKREGWLVKALVEYKMDWGTPGIFGWYASGDDGNVKNGSERLPSIAGSGNFTSFMGDGNLAWGTGYNFYDNNLTYAGTWGIGLQIADVSFVEDLKHTFRVAYWGGTNSPSMVKYMGSAVAWDDTTAVQDGPYLTTNDGLLEFNLVNSWQIYENLEANLELGYIINMMDRDTWDKSYVSDRNWSKQDAWKAQLIFAYSF